MLDGRPVRIEMSGEAATVVQAGTITGGVHVNARQVAPSPARPVTRWHPFDLDVHRAVTVGTTDLPDLPTYLPRDHDRALAGLLSADRSVMVVLTGESSTGKTRAIYEAVADHPELRTWPLRYPRTAEDLLHLLATGIEPGTVLWLNETQNHLTGTHGEQAAAALRTLLELPGPFVVVGTLWPQYWSALTGADQPQARNLLHHRVTRIRVAKRFTGEQMAGAPSDPRLAKALATAHDGEVVQAIAGGPAVVERYDHPDTREDRYATAILSAALDARRLGHHTLLTTPLLVAAAPGYLHDDDRVDAPENWFELGLETATSTHLGVAALIPKRRTPGVGPPDGYHIHDYLDQHGRTTRRRALTPDALWDALLTHAEDPEDQFRLARSAYNRLRYRHADPLYRKASATGPLPSRMKLLDELIGNGRIAEVEDIADESPTPLWAMHAALSRTPSPYRRAFLTRLADRDHGLLGPLLIADLVGSGQVEEAVDILRSWIDAGVDHAPEWLADVLADQGRWDEALVVVRADGGQGWPARWLADRLLMAGNTEKLRRLARTGSFEAHRHLVEVVSHEDAQPDQTRQRPLVDSPSLLTRPGEEASPVEELVLIRRLIAGGQPATAIEALRDALTRANQSESTLITEALADLLAVEGRWAEALRLAKQAPWGRRWVPRQLAKVGNLEALRKLADDGVPEAGPQLAALLAQRGLHDELLDRTAKGDEHCAQQLVALAHSGRLPNGERLLAEGL